MPRAKVDPRLRRRVAHACDSCKRRKAKCNGLLPCEQCKIRCVAASCRYARDSRRASSPSSQDDDAWSNSSTLWHSTGSEREVRLDLAAKDQGLPRGRDLSPSTGVPATNSPATNSPRHEQMLKDCKGRFIYVGESASLSFLETVRSAAHAAVGPCAFTNEPARNPMVESSPKIRFEAAKRPCVDSIVAQDLISQFFLAVSGILDLFDPPWLRQQLQNVMDYEPSKDPMPCRSAVVYLALAIGAQGRAQGSLDERLAEECFAYGRRLTVFHLMDDASLETIQAILLGSYYMLASCQYNAAFINIGIAVRAAYTLGIHLHETNRAFGGDQGLCRERAWKSLRVCDLFLASSLGRPPATSETTSNIDWVPIQALSQGDSRSAPGQVFSAMFRICNVFERILVEVYAKKAVSLELANSISAQHRQWTEELPRMLMVDGLDQPDNFQNGDVTNQGTGMSPRSFGLSLKHGSRVVTMAYYYSIVLLTRPFLTFQTRQSSGRETQSPGKHSTKASLAAYADACVNSAVKGIDIAHEYVFELDTPKRQPLVVNSVFISALCLGLACLDASGRHKWPTDTPLDRAIQILAHLGQLNAQSARYASICRKMREAATIFATRRDDELLRENEAAARSIFGNLDKMGVHTKDHRSSSSMSHNLDALLRRSSWGLPTDEGVTQAMTPPLFDFNTLQEASMLPTSGVMPGQMPNVAYNYPHYEADDASDHHAASVEHALDPLSELFLEQNVPLFPLTSHVSPDSYFSHKNL